MQIDVRYNEFINWPTEVAVKRLEDGLVVWCNHASTQEEEADLGYYDPVCGDYIDNWETIEVCRACNAWRIEDGEWNEQPI